MDDQDPGTSPPADGVLCSPYRSAPSGAAAWRRSVKRKLDPEKRSARDDDDDGKGSGPAARVEADEERAALREAVAAARASAARLRAEVEAERLAAASAASEAMAMMHRLQRGKADAQMELRQFRRFADEKMALDAAETARLRALLARRARRLLRLRAGLREYRLRFLHLGVPLPEGEENVGEEEEEDDLFMLQGEAEDGDGGYYPELRCYDGEYYYVDEEQGEEDGVAVDLDRRVCSLEHDHEPHLLQSPMQEDEGNHLYTDEVLKESSGPERDVLYANQMFPDAAVEERNGLENHEKEIPESPDAGYGSGEEGLCETDVSSASGSDRVYTIDKVHQGVSVPTARVSEKYQNEAVDPDITKLYMRLEALEADRESMHQALVAMRTEKTQLGLLREIAQQLAKDGGPAGVVPGVQHSPGKHAAGIAQRRFMGGKKAALIKTYSMVALFKWILALFCKKKKARQSRYTFGLSNNNVGLLLLLDKSPQIQKILMTTK